MFGHCDGDDAAARAERRRIVLATLDEAAEIFRAEIRTRGPGVGKSRVWIRAALDVAAPRAVSVLLALLDANPDDLPTLLDLLVRQAACYRTYAEYGARRVVRHAAQT